MQKTAVALIEARIESKQPRTVSSLIHLLQFFNPRCTCTARVTVLSVCLSVSPYYVHLSPATLAPQATKRPRNDTSGFRRIRLEKSRGNFLETIVSKRYGINHLQLLAVCVMGSITHTSHLAHTCVSLCIPARTIFWDNQLSKLCQ